MDETPMAGHGTRVGTIACVTPSPAIDRTARVARLVLGTVLRPVEVVALPGGKGLNAARAAHRMGAPVATTGLAGGHAGGWLVEALEREGLSPRFAPAARETRTTYVTVDPSGRSVIVYEPSEPVSAEEWEGFLGLLAREVLPAAAWVIAAGSLPTGVAPDGYARIEAACRAADRPVLVDTSGPALVAALEAGPDVVKVGRAEAVAAGLAGPRATARGAARALAARGARLAVVTDGQRDGGASDGRTTWSMSVPEVSTVNTVGSGDAFNAALVMALAGGAPVERALARGVAAGSANALALAGGMLDPAVVDELARRVLVRTVTGPGLARRRDRGTCSCERRMHPG
jgi:1-phosphofructokinase family hexose kinase